MFDKDDPGVLDFNLACAFRVELHEMERDKTRAKLIAFEVSKIFGDGSTGSEATPSDVEVW